MAAIKEEAFSGKSAFSNHECTMESHPTGAEQSAGPYVLGQNREKQQFLNSIDMLLEVHGALDEMGQGCPSSKAEFLMLLIV